MAIGGTGTLPLDVVEQHVEVVVPVALLLTTVHLTGDLELLRDEWRPELSIGVTGGYSAETLADVVHASVAALTDAGSGWERSRPGYDLMQRVVEWAKGTQFDRRVAPGSAPDSYDFSPKDPAPTVGGSTLLTPSLPAGPHDQRGVEARPDVLSYTSDVLRQPYTVLGAVWVTLHAASSAPDTDFVARLVDVYPDGRAIGIADGVIRASARASYPGPGVVAPVPPAPIAPGVVYEYRIDLWATGLTFLAGHRVRVDVTSSSHPRWDRNLNTGRSAYDSAVTAVARQRIFHGPDRPSRITLTVVDR